MLNDYYLDKLKTGDTVDIEYNGYNIKLTPELVLREETRVQIFATLKAYNKNYNFKTTTLLRFVKDKGTFEFMIKQIGISLDKEMFKDRGILKL